MDDEIECPMHQGIFNIKSGEALSPPACEDLKTYPVKVDNDKISKPFIQNKNLFLIKNNAIIRLN